MIGSDLDTESDGLATVFMPDERHSPRSLLIAINETSAAARNGWLVFLGLLAYFLVALASITHKDLLVNAPVELPILGIGVSLDRFFLFAPMFLLFIHAGLLIQHVMLSRKLSALDEQIALEEDRKEVHPLRHELHSYFFTQVIAGPPRSAVFTTLLNIMVTLSLYILPLLLLLYFQIAYLPYHDLAMTWAHRAYVLLDVLMLLSVSLFLRTPDAGIFRAFFKAMVKRPLQTIIGIIGLVMISFFSLFVATIPDQFMDRLVLALSPSFLERRIDNGSGTAAPRQAFVLTALLLEPDLAGREDGPVSLFHRNLIVTDQDLVANKTDAYGEISLSLRNRDLRYARLSGSDLHRADFTGADLSGADLSGADLRGTRFACSGIGDDGVEYQITRKNGCSLLVRANLSRADLRGANLGLSDLSQAVLSEADMRGVRLYRSILQGVDAGVAKLAGAFMNRADFSGADLSWANLQAVQAHGALFRGARLTGVKLQGANIAYGFMEGANLSDAGLQASVLTGVQFYGANFSGARLTSADMRNVTLWRTVPPSPDAMRFAVMAGGQLSPPGRDEINQIDAFLKQTVRPALRPQMIEKMQPVIDRYQIEGWKTSQSWRDWQGLLQQSAATLTDAADRQQAEILAGLVCGDHGDDGVVARTITTRVLKEGLVVGKAFVRLVSEPTCVGAANIPKPDMIRLHLLAKTQKAPAAAKPAPARTEEAPDIPSDQTNQMSPSITTP